MVGINPEWLYIDARCRKRVEAEMPDAKSLRLIDSITYSFPGSARAIASARRGAGPIGLFAAAAALTACASGQDPGGPRAGTVPADVALARLSQNMSRAEVEALLGQPDGMQQVPGEVGYQYLARPVPRRGVDLTDFYAVFRDDRLVGWGVGGVQAVADAGQPTLVIAALGDGTRPSPPPAAPAPGGLPPPPPAGTGEVAIAASPEPGGDRLGADRARWREAVTAALSAEPAPVTVAGLPGGATAPDPATAVPVVLKVDPSAEAYTRGEHSPLIEVRAAPALPADATGAGVSGPLAKDALRERLAAVRRQIAAPATAPRPGPTPPALVAVEPTPLAPVGPGPGPESLESARVFIHHRAGDPAAAARARALAQRLEWRGARKVTLRPVRLGIDGLSVRYFHGVDRPGAAAVIADAASFAGDGQAAATPVPADFTGFQPAPSLGLIEIWLPSSGA